MKRSIMSFIFFSLISIQVSAQNYGLDNADPAIFSKFRIPETDLSSLWFNTGLDFTSYRSTYQTGTNYLSTNFSYRLSPRYYLLKESDDRYLSLNVNVDGNYQRSYRNNVNTVFSTNDYSRTALDEFDVAVDEVYRNYAFPHDIFYSLGSNDQVSLSAEYDDQRKADSTRGVFYVGQKHQGYIFSIGIGWGKMRNVTSVVSAMRFQDRLKQLNLVNGDLSENTIEDLAAQFYKQGYYSSVHVRPDKYFWDDVEKTLSSDGVSLSGLNQYADSYIREVPGELRFSRNEGIVTGVDLQINYNNSYSSLNPILEQLYTLGNVYLDYSHQMNLNSQITFNLSLSGGPNIIKSYYGMPKQEYVIAPEVGYDYELTDRMVASIDNSFGLTFENYGTGTGQLRVLSNVLGFLLNYFVEDNVSLTLSYSWSYDDNKYRANRTTQSDNNIKVGFTFYLERGFLYK